MTNKNKRIVNIRSQSVNIKEYAIPFGDNCEFPNPVDGCIVYTSPRLHTVLNSELHFTRTDCQPRIESPTLKIGFPHAKYYIRNYPVW